MPESGVFRRLFFLALFVCHAPAWADTMVPPGVISGSVVWTRAGSPYHVNGGVAVHGPTGPRLTIEAGVEVRFGPGAYLQIGQTGYPHASGRITAVGTAELPIVFTAENGQTGGWTGLLFTGSMDAAGFESRMEHCIVEKAVTNLHMSGTNQPDTLRFCEFRMAGNRGLQLDDACPLVANCTFTDNPTALRVGNIMPTTIGGHPLLANRFEGSGSWFVYNHGSGAVDARWNSWCPDSGQELDSLIRDLTDSPVSGLVEWQPVAPAPPVTLQLAYARETGMLLLEWTFDGPAESFTVLSSASAAPGAVYTPIAVTQDRRLELAAPLHTSRRFFRVTATLLPCDQRRIDPAGAGW